jgi:hypothetical protein
VAIIAALQVPSGTEPTVAAGELMLDGTPALEAAPAGAAADDNPYLAKHVDFTPMPPGHYLLAVDPNQQPYRIDLPPNITAQGETYRSRLRICVSEAGEVSHVDILVPSIPAIDLQLPVVIPRWRYHPYLIEGHAKAFCYLMNYQVG